MGPVERGPDQPRGVDQARFYREYARLAKAGLCDEPGGAECYRVWAEWIEEGFPADVEAFIRNHANRGV